MLAFSAGLLPLEVGGCVNLAGILELTLPTPSPTSSSELTIPLFSNVTCRNGAFEEVRLRRSGGVSCETPSYQDMQLTANSQLMVVVQLDMGGCLSLGWKMTPLLCCPMLLFKAFTYSLTGRR